MLKHIILVLSSVIAVGCASLGGGNVETSFWGARAAYVEAKRGFEAFLIIDNEQVEQCFLDWQFSVDGSVPVTDESKLIELCPALLSDADRAVALNITHLADTEFKLLDAELEAGDGTSIGASEALGRLGTLTLRLIVLYGGAN